MPGFGRKKPFLVTLAVYIGRALGDRGSANRRELARRVGARYSQPAWR